jgi:hypothetical protein
VSTSGGFEDQLLADLAFYSDKPYDFVLWAFPWGEGGTDLAERKGPEPWQAKILLDLQHEFEKGEAQGNAAFGTALAEAYQIAVRSGHDIGKTAFISWLMWWGLSTREDTRGRATANTERQLRQILWAEIAKWHRLFIARSMFEVSATAMFAKDPERQKNWRIDAIPWSEENPEAFAGLHNYGKRIIIIFDEASAIIDKIWETTDGVAHEANTEIIWVCTGNPTRNYGRFYECFNRFASEWHTYKIDSRDVSFANKEKINRAIALWGIDSDYVRVRYLGEFPSSSATQLIGKDLIREARTRSVVSFPYEALIMTVDVARFGTNMSVIGFRRGRDARTIPVQRFRGLTTIELGQRVAALISQYGPDAVFIDEGGVGGGVVDYVRHLGHSVIGVNFGAKPSSRPNGILVANKRAEMYVALREWLREGGAIEDSDELEDELVQIEYYFNPRQEIVLVAKEDMAAESPDWADQLAMSFAYPVSARAWRRPGGAAKVEYDPLSHAAMSGEYQGWH